jgi:chromosome segregation ATPase
LRRAGVESPQECKLGDLIHFHEQDTYVNEAVLMRTQLNQKTIALESCNLELDNMKKELEKAKEYIGNLRAQLEENTQTLCSYLANCS